MLTRDMMLEKAVEVAAAYAGSSTKMNMTPAQVLEEIYKKLEELQKKA